MSGDGVSIPTSLAQIGNVAKSQARSQNTTTPTTPFAEQVGKQEELKVQRVKETQDAAEAKVKREKEEKDNRKRRRLNRQKKNLAKDNDLDLDQNPEKDEDSQEEEIGCLLDLRV